jgi:hypothetical protein
MTHRIRNYSWLGAIMDAFRVLHRIEWSAPWKTEAGCK